MKLRLSSFVDNYPIGS